MLFILLCGFTIFMKFYFAISWTLSLIVSIFVGGVFIILDGIFTIGKYIILFGIAVFIVYYGIHLFGG